MVFLCGEMERGFKPPATPDEEPWIEWKRIKKTYKGAFAIAEKNAEKAANSDKKAEEKWVLQTNKNAKFVQQSLEAGGMNNTKVSNSNDSKETWGSHEWSMQVLKEAMTSTAEGFLPKIDGAAPVRNFFPGADPSAGQDARKSIVGPRDSMTNVLDEERVKNAEAIPITMTSGGAIDAAMQATSNEGRPETPYTLMVKKSKEELDYIQGVSSAANSITAQLEGLVTALETTGKLPALPGLDPKKDAKSARREKREQERKSKADAALKSVDEVGEI